MNRRKFLGLAGTSVIVIAGTAYLFSDKSPFVRADIDENTDGNMPFKPDEREILYLASLAPSGHNTQPWIVKYLEPYHWIIASDRGKWLPAVDPTQRETILSIGAFLQNLEYAAAGRGYQCSCCLLANSNQSEDIMEIWLKKTGKSSSFDPNRIRQRRTVRSGFLPDPLQNKDLAFITGQDRDLFHFYSNDSKEYQWLNEQTIEANRQQAYRDDAQSELADWMRLSSRDAEKYCDGLTTASMEISGIPGWVVRNFYSRKTVMGAKFREQGLDKVRKQVSRSGGWLLITSKDSSTSSLLETGKLLQRMLLKTRERNIAIHPMTQILEETPFRDALYTSTGIRDTVQFVLRTGYLKHYPDPVSLRRPVERFVKR